jgi:hypothetical protein
MKKTLLLLALLAGCASKPVWEHPRKDSSEFKTDQAECERFFGGNDREVLRCLDRMGWKEQRRK